MSAKRILSLGILMTVQPARADWVIIQTTTTAGQDQQMTMKIKDNMIRNDIGGSKTVLLKGNEGGAADGLRREEFPRIRRPEQGHGKQSKAMVNSLSRLFPNNTDFSGVVVKSEMMMGAGDHPRARVGKRAINQCR
jgi:hypothetical protein